MFRLALHWQILIAMIVGAAVGVTMNVAFGERHVVQKVGGLELIVDDTTNRIDVTIVDAEKRDDPDGGRRTRIIDGTGRVDGALPTVARLAEVDPQAYELFRRYARSPARRVGDAADAVGQLFLRALKMVAIPLIVTSLITGVTGLGSATQLGKMFSRTLLYYLATSLLAIVTGLLMVNLIRPGVRDDRPPQSVEDIGVAGDLPTVLYQQLEALIPANPFDALAGADFLSIIAFSLLFAVFTIVVGGRPAELIGEFFSAAFKVMMAMTMAIIYLAPLGVLCLMMAATATQGIDVFRALAWYMFTVLLALAMHALVTLPLILYFVARRNPAQFARAMSPALLTAFSSASSNATLPLTMSNVELRADVSNRVGSFVLPLGATINMDGTALYEAVAVLFIAQMSNFDLSLAQQIIIAFTALLASVGAAGIPHAGLVMMIIILQAVGLPTDLQGLIIAVDRVLDMCRTATNVWSDSCGCAVIDRFEPPPGTTPRHEPVAAATAGVGD